MKQPGWFNKGGIDFPVFLLLLLLPLQWKGEAYVDLGFFNLGLGQIPSWLLLFLGFFRPLTFVRFFRQAPVFNILFIAYYLILGLFVIRSADFETVLGIYRGTIRTLIFYFAVGAYLMSVPRERLERTVFLAGPISLVLFIFFAYYAVANTPRNELNPQILTGNPRIVLLTMINYSPGNSLSWEDEEVQNLSRKNSIAAAFNTLLNLFVILGLRTRKRVLSLFTVIALLLFPLVVFALLSRSNFAALLAGTAMALLIIQISPRVSTRSKLVSIVIALVVLLAFATFMSAKTGYVADFTEAQAERYEATEGDVRWSNYKRALRDIAEDPIMGKGVAVRVSDGLAVHNLILGAWFQMGLAGLFIALAYYCTLLAYMARMTLDVVLNPKKLADAWIPALLVIPMTRALISGAYGQWGTPDAVAVAFFIYLYGRRFGPKDSALPE